MENTEKHLAALVIEIVRYMRKHRRVAVLQGKIDRLDGSSLEGIVDLQLIDELDALLGVIRKDCGEIVKRMDLLFGESISGEQKAALAGCALRLGGYHPVVGFVYAHDIAHEFNRRASNPRAYSFEVEGPFRVFRTKGLGQCPDCGQIHGLVLSTFGMWLEMEVTVRYYRHAHVCGDMDASDVIRIVSSAKC